MSLASLVVELSASTVKFQSDMGQAVHMAQRAANDIKHALQSVAELFGVGLGVHAFKGFVEGAIDAADALNDLRTRSGLTGQELIVLQGAAVRGGVELEAISQTVSRMGVRLGAAAKGTGEASVAFKAMGISVVDAAGKTKTINDIMREVGEKFKTYEDGADKATLATAAFGKGGDKLIPVIEGIKETEEQFHHLGITINEDFISKADKFNDTLKDMRSVTDLFARSIAETLLPILQRVLTAFLNAGAAGGSFRDKMVAAVSAFGDTSLKSAINDANKAIVEETDHLFKLQKMLEEQQAGTGAYFGKNSITQLQTAIVASEAKLADLRKQVAGAELGLGPDEKPKEKTPAPRLTKAVTDAGLTLDDVLAKGAVKRAQLREDEWNAELKGLLDFNKEQEKASQAWTETEARAALTRVKLDDEANAEILKNEQAWDDMMSLAALTRLKMYESENKQSAKEVTDFWRKAAEEIQQSMSGFFFDVMQGKLADLGASFKKTVDQMVANALAAKAATALFGSDFTKGGDIGGLLGKVVPFISGLFGSGTSGAVGQSFKSNAGSALLGGFATGTNYVPRTGYAMVHQGEAIIPASRNGRVMGPQITMNISTPDANSFRASQGQILSQMHLALASGRRNL